MACLREATSPKIIQNAAAPRYLITNIGTIQPSEEFLGCVEIEACLKFGDALLHEYTAIIPLHDLEAMQRQIECAIKGALLLLLAPVPAEGAKN